MRLQDVSLQGFVISLISVVAVQASGMSLDSAAQLESAARKAAHEMKTARTAYTAEILARHRAEMAAQYALEAAIADSAIHADGETISQR